MSHRISFAKNRNTDSSRRSFISATGEILAKKGFRSFTPTEVARVAGKDKRLIKHHFGSLNNLLQTYIDEKDFWFTKFRQFEKPEDVKEFLFQVFKDQFEFFVGSAEMQQFIKWELTEYHPVISAAASRREIEASRLVDLMCKEIFEKSGINIQALLTLLARPGYTTDLKWASGNIPGGAASMQILAQKNACLDTISQVLDWAWDAAIKQNKKR